MADRSRPLDPEIPKCHDTTCGKCSRCVDERRCAKAELRCMDLLESWKLVNDFYAELNVHGPMKTSEVKDPR